MTIEAAPGRAVVTLSREELARYGIAYDGMSLADSGTRLMLGDMLKMLEHMGIIENAGPRRPRVSIECARGLSGGCTLFFGIHTDIGENTGRTYNAVHDDRAVHDACADYNDRAEHNCRILRFSGADSVRRAAEAGAFAGGLVPVPDGGGYTLELPEDIEWWREGLLREFAEERCEE